MKTSKQVRDYLKARALGCVYVTDDGRVHSASGLTGEGLIRALLMAPSCFTPTAGRKYIDQVA